MLDQKSGHIKMFLYETDGIHQFLCFIRVHTCSRLIQKKKLRIGCQCSGDLEFTLFTIWKVSCKGICFFVEVEYLEDLHCFFIHFFFYFVIFRKS